MEQLLRDGYAILPSVLTAGELEAARMRCDANADALSDPLARHAAVADLVAERPRRGARWLASTRPGDPKEGAYVIDWHTDGAGGVNVIWALDDFTADNGATELIPGSHCLPWTGRVNASTMVRALMSAGSVLVFLSPLVHRPGSGITRLPRRALRVASYVARDQ